jgi:hypothetical protein
LESGPGESPGPFSLARAYLAFAFAARRMWR